MIFSQKKLEIEGDEKPLYTSTAGGQIGWVTYRGPFISLRIYDEFIIIGCGSKMVLKYDEIISVEIKQWMGLMPDRIQINHQELMQPENRYIVGLFCTP